MFNGLSSSYKKYDVTLSPLGAHGMSDSPSSSASLEPTSIISPSILGKDSYSTSSVRCENSVASVIVSVLSSSSPYNKFAEPPSSSKTLTDHNNDAELAVLARSFSRPKICERYPRNDVSLSSSISDTSEGNASGSSDVRTPSSPKLNDPEVKMADLKHLNLPMGPLTLNINSHFISDNSSAFGGSLYTDRGPSCVFCGVGTKFRHWKNKVHQALKTDSREYFMDGNNPPYNKLSSFDDRIKISSSATEEGKIWCSDMESKTRIMKADYRNSDVDKSGEFEGFESLFESKMQGALLASYEEKHRQNSSTSVKSEFRAAGSHCVASDKRNMEGSFAIKQVQNFFKRRRILRLLRQHLDNSIDNAIFDSPDLLSPISNFDTYPIPALSAKRLAHATFESNSTIGYRSMNFEKIHNALSNCAPAFDKKHLLQSGFSFHKPSDSPSFADPHEQKSISSFHVGNGTVNKTKDDEVTNHVFNLAAKVNYSSSFPRNSESEIETKFGVHQTSCNQTHEALLPDFETTNFPSFESCRKMEDLLEFRRVATRLKKHLGNLKREEGFGGSKPFLLPKPPPQEVGVLATSINGGLDDDEALMKAIEMSKCDHLAHKDVDVALGSGDGLETGFSAGSEEDGLETGFSAGSEEDCLKTGFSSGSEEDGLETGFSSGSEEDGLETGFSAGSEEDSLETGFSPGSEDRLETRLFFMDETENICFEIRFLKVFDESEWHLSRYKLRHSFRSTLLPFSIDTSLRSSYMASNLGIMLASAMARIFDIHYYIHDYSTYISPYTLNPQPPHPPTPSTPIPTTQQPPLFISLTLHNLSLHLPFQDPQTPFTYPLKTPKTPFKCLPCSALHNPPPTSPLSDVRQLSSGSHDHSKSLMALIKAVDYPLIKLLCC
ncbi:hypothetical protein FHG87_018358 [Trinorchestia longiramus]|nr:hypothetical protein FHG87_018358 [Trinorchestia longiramus]